MKNFSCLDHDSQLDKLTLLIGPEMNREKKTYRLPLANWKVVFLVPNISLKQKNFVCISIFYSYCMVVSHRNTTDSKELKMNITQKAKGGFK